jgi:probable rRNA maturation factor
MRLLRRATKTLLEDLMGYTDFDLGVHFVTTAEITHLNETYLQHQGSTDVITFDYKDHAEPVASPHSSFVIRHSSLVVPLHGEIFICVEEAVRQARRFRARWQDELVRYIVHGVLHLSGYDDQRAADRRKMKRQEDRRLEELKRRFCF